MFCFGGRSDYWFGFSCWAGGGGGGGGCCFCCCGCGGWLVLFGEVECLKRTCDGVGVGIGIGIARKPFL